MCVWVDESLFVFRTDLLTIDLVGIKWRCSLTGIFALNFSHSLKLENVTVNCAFNFCSSKAGKAMPKAKPQKNLWKRVGVAQKCNDWAQHTDWVWAKLTFYCCLCVGKGGRTGAHIKPHKKVVNSIVISQTKHRKWAEWAAVAVAVAVACLPPNKLFFSLFFIPLHCCRVPLCVSLSLSSQLCGLKRCLLLKTKHFLCFVFCI